VLLDVDTAPASTKNATSIKLLSVAEIAATAKPKVLNPWEKCKAWCRLKTLLLPLLQGALTEGVCRHDWLLRGGKSRDEHGLQQESIPIVLRVLASVSLIKGCLGTLRWSLEERKLAT